MKDNLNILCFGAGAIGTYLGGSLALAGCNVIFLEMPEVARLIKQNGIHIKTENAEEFISAPRLVNDLGQVLSEINFDAAILAVKSFDTPSILRDLEPYKSKLPPLICFQNGVENEKLIEDLFRQKSGYSSYSHKCCRQKWTRRYFSTKIKGSGFIFLKSTGSRSDRMDEQSQSAGGLYQG